MTSAEVESIKRALVHHELQGVIRSWSPPIPGASDTFGKAWKVTLWGRERAFYTLAQVRAVCAALAAASQHAVATTNETETSR